MRKQLDYLTSQRRSKYCLWPEYRCYSHVKDRCLKESVNMSKIIMARQEWIKVIPWDEDDVTLLLGEGEDREYIYRTSITNTGAAELIRALTEAIEINEGREPDEEFDDTNAAIAAIEAEYDV